MKKLFSKISALFLGLAMAIGVGAAIGSNVSVSGVNAADKNLSFSFTSCPSGWPSGSSSSANTKTYTISGVAYTFSLGANVYYNTNKYLMLKSTTYLGMPAISGYKLTKVEATNSSGCSTKTNVGISSSSSSASYISGGDKQLWSTTSKKYVYPLSGTSANTMYYLYITSANSQIVQLDLTYESTSSKTLESIDVTTQPSKVTYNVNETLDTSGIVVTGTYDDESTENVTSGCTYDPTTLSTAGSQTITVTHTASSKTTTFTVTVNGGPTPVGSGFNKVTSAPSDWSGEYLLVYESDSTTANCWTGVDASGCYVTTTINNNNISAAPSGACTVTIDTMGNGYSIKVNGGTNNGKYISGTSAQNKTNFNDEGQLNTISYDSSSVKIVSNTSVMRCNSSSSNWFRYFKSTSYTNQQPVQLYKKQSTTEESVSITRTDSKKDVVYLEHEYEASAVNFTASSWSFSISDATVASIKSQDTTSGTCIVTLNGIGSTTLTATATKQGGGTVVGTMPVSATEKGLKSINISNPKTQYYVGDSFQEKTGTLTLTYSDDSQEVTSEYTENHSTVVLSKPGGPYTVTISKTINGVQRQTTYEVTVINDPYVFTSIRIVVDSQFKKDDVPVGGEWDKGHVKFYKVYTHSDSHAEDPREYTPQQTEGDMVTYSPDKPVQGTTTLTITWEFTGKTTAQEVVNGITTKMGYKLVTDDSLLVEDTEVYIGYVVGEKLTIGTTGFGSGFMNVDDVDGGNDSTTVIIPTENMNKFVLKSAGSNLWYFQNSAGRLSGNGDALSMSSVESSSNGEKWSISINSSGEATIISENTNTDCALRGNTTYSQKRLKLYKDTQKIVKLFAIIPVYLRNTDTFNIGNSIDLNDDTTHTLNGTISYRNNLTETLSIESSDDTVVSISNISHNYAGGTSTFTATGLSNGEATITVKGDTSEVELTQTIVVSTSLDYIIVPTDPVGVGVGQIYNLYNVITYVPETTTERDLFWEITSDNKDNALLDEDTGDFYSEVEDDYTISVMDAKTNLYEFVVTVSSPYTYDSLEASIPTGKFYHLGDSFDTTNTVVNAVFKNASGDIQYNNITGDPDIEWTIPQDFAHEIKSYDIELSYTIDDITKDTSLTVTLDTITNITVESSTIANSIKFGTDNYSYTGVIKAYTASEPNGFVVDNDYVNFGTVNTLSLGEQSVNVSYGGKTATLDTYVTNVGTSFYEEGFTKTGAGFCRDGMPDHWSQSGCGSDYSSSNHKLKMDGTGDSFYSNDLFETTASSITVTVNVKNNSITSTGSYLTIYALDKNGKTIDGIQLVLTISDKISSGSSGDIEGDLLNPNNIEIYDIKAVYTKSTGNLGVDSCTVSVETKQDSTKIAAQKDAMATYLAKFKTCISGWNSRDEIKNLVIEYNAMAKPAKEQFELLTIKDYDWNNINEYDMSTHEYTGGDKSLEDVSVITKLKDMVDYYNKSLQPSEEQLVLQLPTGVNFVGYQKPYSILLNSFANNGFIIAIVTIVSIASVGAYFYIRRKKEN